MHFYLSLAALIALGGKAYSQAITGPYTIRDTDWAVDRVLTSQDSRAIFSEATWEKNQVWQFTSVGGPNVLLQNLEDEGFLTCPAPGAACYVEPTAQMAFVTQAQSGGRYTIMDETKQWFLAENIADKTVVLVREVREGQKISFTLTRAQRCK